MKVEFEIEEADAALLLDTLELAAGRVSGEESLKAIQKLIKEIRHDISNGAQIFSELQARLKNFTDGSPITLKSNFKTQLGMSLNFIESTEGLLIVLNWILERLVLLYKQPGAKPNKIKLSEIGDANFIDDLVALIGKHYDKS